MCLDSCLSVSGNEGTNMDTKKNSLDAFLLAKEGGLGLALPEKVYHYTTTLDEDKIKTELKCRNSTKHEDKQEFKLGLSLLQDIFPTFQKSSKVKCWTFSLCSENYNRRMLGKYSCSKQGSPLILEYNFDDIRRRVRALMDKAIVDGALKARGCYYFLPCLYRNKDEDAIWKLKAFLFGKYLSNLKCFLPLSDDFLKEACSHIFRAMVKDEQYSFEQELRLVRITFTGSNMERIPFGFNPQPVFTSTIATCAFCDAKGALQ